MERRRPLRMGLRVEVRDKDGNLVETREREGDLILDNFKDILAALLLPYFTWSIATGIGLTPFDKRASLVGLDGATWSVPIYGGHTLGTKDSTSICFTGLAGYDEIAAGGMGVDIGVGTSTVSPGAFLIFRDTFTPISVPAGGTISVTYTLSL